MRAYHSYRDAKNTKCIAQYRTLWMKCWKQHLSSQHTKLRFVDIDRVNPRRPLRHLLNEFVVLALSLLCNLMNSEQSFHAKCKIHERISLFSVNFSSVMHREYANSLTNVNFSIMIHQPPWYEYVGTKRSFHPVQVMLETSIRTVLHIVAYSVQRYLFVMCLFTARCVVGQALCWTENKKDMFACATPALLPLLQLHLWSKRGTFNLNVASEQEN